MSTTAPAETRPRTGFRDAVRREWYLVRFEWAMEDYPGKAGREIRKDLRRDLAVAAAEVGTRRALQDLGHPKVLAERYKTELGRRLPSYTTGAIAAGLVIGLLVLLWLAYALGTLDTLESFGGGTVTTHPLGATATFTYTDDLISAEAASSWQGALVYAVPALVAFVLGSRLWRLRG